MTTNIGEIAVHEYTIISFRLPRQLDLTIRQAAGIPANEGEYSRRVRELLIRSPGYKGNAEVTTREPLQHGKGITGTTILTIAEAEALQGYSKSQGKDFDQMVYELIADAVEGMNE